MNFFTMVVRVFQPSKRAASIPDCALLIFLKRVHPNNKTAWLYSPSLNFLRASMLGFELWMSYYSYSGNCKKFSRKNPRWCRCFVNLEPNILNQLKSFGFGKTFAEIFFEGLFFQINTGSFMFLNKIDVYVMFT